MQWEDENFSEVPDENVEELDNTEYQEEPLEEYELEEQEQSASHEDEDPLSLTQEEENLLGTAMIRLDQARLYEMLVKHDLFEGVQANPIALKAVQKEIKTFIMDRLEILLGLKTEKQVKTNVLGQFNDLEVQALKDLAFAATKGATRQQRETPKPVNSIPQRTSLKPLAAKPRLETPERAPVKMAKAPQNSIQKTIPRPQAKPIQKKKSNNDLPPLKKKISDMSSDELMERAKMSSDIYKGRTAVNPQALPPPSFEQQMLQYSTVLSNNSVGAALMKGLGGNGVHNVGDGE